MPEAPDTWKTCPLCDRPIPPGHESRHHLIPKVKGGAKGPCAILHPACHSKIHAVLTEAELARSYSTIEALRSHPEIATFIRWISRRPPELRVKNRSLRKKRSR